MPVNASQTQSPQNQVFAQPAPPKRSIFKNKKVTVLLAIILSLVLILGSVFAFMNFNKPAVVPTSGIKTITFWGRSLDAETVNTLISEYESQNTNVKIVYEKQVETDYKDKLQTRLGINNIASLPDIAELDEAWLEEMFPYFTPVTNPAILSRYSDATIENNTVNNVTYTVPFKFDSLALAYNKRHMFDYLTATQQNEVDFDKLDWSSLLTRAKSLTQTRVTQDASKIKESVELTRGGIAIGSPTTVTNADKIMQLLLIQNNAVLFNSTQNKFVLDSKFSEVMRFYTNFNVEGGYGVWNDYLGNDISAFTQGKLSMMLVKSEDIDQIQKLNPNMEFVTVLPAKIGSIQNISLSRSLATIKTRPNAAEAMKFIEFLTRSENGTKLHNANNRNTFIPAQRESLASIPKNSHFSVFANINPSAKKFKVPFYTESTAAIRTFLQESYTKNFSGIKKGDPIKNFDYNLSQLESSLNVAVTEASKK
jgi:ABC-type glycerol-3-phosphate transport system substrate-binding protein